MASQFLALCLIVASTSAFVPSSFIRQDAVPRTGLSMFDASLMDATTTMESMSMFMQHSSSNILATADEGISGIMSTFMDQSSNLLSFADQGQNLAGIFFQASLLPYLLFLYFLGFRANRISDIGNFGFQFVLLFVFFTIPSGIISKLTYDCSLADVDWLHGGAELLLTVANILIVLGFKEASTNPNPPKIDTPRTLAFGSAVLFALACAAGPTLGFEAHSAFLLGAGNLSPDTVESLSWVSHSEPENALSIPTWIIHFSSVFEYLIAMDLVWKYSEVTKNEKWKGMTWGMLPLHASGVCACTYHFFYNPSALQFLVSMQAGFTLLGNLTCAIAAYRIARSNGWSFDEVNPFEKSSPRIEAADGVAAMPLDIVQPEESNLVLAGKVVGLTLVASYLVKYGELGLDIPFTPNAPLALAMVLGFPALTAYNFYRKGEGSKDGNTGGLFDFMQDKGLSMDDVKKYGVAGTVAYVLTELAFWVIAFPVAAYALYQSTGHWPDVINEANDRAAVLAFIFAGANIARAFVPLRLGAALALAPWVDENILKGKSNGAA